jgi:hypothetical protein
VEGKIRSDGEVRFIDLAIVVDLFVCHWGLGVEGAAAPGV